MVHFQAYEFRNDFIRFLDIGEKLNCKGLRDAFGVVCLGSVDSGFPFLETDGFRGVEVGGIEDSFPLGHFLKLGFRHNSNN